MKNRMFFCSIFISIFARFERFLIILKIISLHYKNVNSLISLYFVYCFCLLKHPTDQDKTHSPIRKNPTTYQGKIHPSVKKLLPNLNKIHPLIGLTHTHPSE